MTTATNDMRETMGSPGAATDRGRAGAERSQSASETPDQFAKARGTVAGAIDSAAKGLHDRAENLPGVATASSIAHGAADRLESTAQYVREHGAGEMVEDVRNVIRSHPGKSLLVAAVVGFAAARALRE